MTDLEIGIIILLIIYFLPTIIAVNRKHPNTLAIFIVNTFFGLTAIGWVTALIWSVLSIDKSRN